MKKFTNEEEKLLKLFQTEANRRCEEEFAKIFAETDDVRVAFINEGRAFTDGRNIVVDPAEDKIFSDAEAIKNTLRFLRLDNFTCTSWDALKLTTRSQNIHECLHILYTAFPPLAANDKRSSTKARMITLAMIDNVIEDSYIEAVGCSVYNNAEMFLKWGRIARLFSAHPSQGTFSQKLEEAEIDPSDAARLMYIINYMATELLYPMLELEQPKNECGDYLSEIRPLYLSGSVAPSPAERHRYACMIFDILEKLIPDSEELLDVDYFERITGGTATHSPTNRSVKPLVSNGRTARVTRKLFTTLDDKKINGSDLSDSFFRFLSESKNAYRIALTEDESVSKTFVFTCSELDGAAIHSGINVIETHPKPDMRLARAYLNIVKQYRTSINTYISRFEHLLNAEKDISEEKQLFGSNISSKNFADPKKRYWCRKISGRDIPELSVLFMIDGSGSMSGKRRKAAMNSAVILHEVLSAHNVEHAIVEHRAVFGEPYVNHNVLTGFNAKSAEKYNILLLDSYGGTREGLSLLWAERYLTQNSTSENKIIVVISDGLPAHEYGGIKYFPPVSVTDTRNTAMKISHRKTKIISIALGEGGDSCYDELKQIYPRTVDCTDLNALTGQLLRIISKELNAFR